jgi:hypothetical protein
MAEFITIERVGLSKSDRTAVFHVKNRRSDDLLGVIGWYGPWRQYCFSPEPHTVYSSGCLADVEHFIRRAMADRHGVCGAGAA